jgi:hypothetical protein
VTGAEASSVKHTHASLHPIAPPHRGHVDMMGGSRFESVDSRCSLSNDLKFTCPAGTFVAAVALQLWHALCFLLFSSVQFFHSLDGAVGHRTAHCRCTILQGARTRADSGPHDDRD